MINITSSEKTEATVSGVEKKKKKLTKKEKIIAGVAFLIFIIFLISIGNGNKKTTTETPKIAVNYNLVKSWSVPNGEGKLVVIPPNFQDENSLLLVCDKIEQDTKNITNVFLWGCKDDKSADLWQKDASLLTQDELTYSEPILYFFKNANTGVHECSVFGSDSNGKIQKKTY